MMDQKETPKIKFAIAIFWLGIACSHCGVASAAEKPYHAPRLSNGQPDFEGIWDHSNATPLVRLDTFKTLKITADEAMAIGKALHAFVHDPGPNDPDGELSLRKVEPIRGEWRSSIVSDPDAGKLPGTADFETWDRAAIKNVFGAFDGPEQRPNSERCLGDPSAQPPILHNPGMNLHQIIQTKNTIVFHSETMHEARIIRLNSSHVPAAVTSWLGDSIAWWEGETLVVETKYFAPTDTGRQAPFVSYRLSAQANVIERFTRISATQLDYAFTVTDPVNYTRPWSGETQFLRSSDRMFEYACHEGNYSLGYGLLGERVKEKQR
jgi:hypothetical protein